MGGKKGRDLDNERKIIKKKREDKKTDLCNKRKKRLEEKERDLNNGRKKECGRKRKRNLVNEKSDSRKKKT